MMLLMQERMQCSQMVEITTQKIINKKKETAKQLSLYYRQQVVDDLN